MIKKVIHWANGMVMVFDENGKQMPEYQGIYEEVKDKILKDSNENTEFAGGNWSRGIEESIKKESW